MDNIIHLFDQPKQTPVKDVSNETYFFTFVGTKFHFGGGAFTRDLLERLNANRDAVKQLINRETSLKLSALADAALDAETAALLEKAVRLESDCSLGIIDTLHTPNDLDAYLSDDDASVFMSLILAATIHSSYVPFDLLRMQRANWCLIEGDANQFMAALDTFFTATDKKFAILKGAQSK